MSARTLPPFEELEHTADLRLRVRGGDLKELFIHAAQGMFHLMRCVPGKPGKVTRHIVLESPDVETLLVDWLNELRYLAETGRECYEAYEIHLLEPTRLKAIVYGRTDCSPSKIIKAATFFDLHVACDEAGCQATITFDT